MLNLRANTDRFRQGMARAAKALETWGRQKQPLRTTEIKAMKRAEFKCQANEAEVYIYDIIGKDFWGEGVDAKGFVDDLNDLKDIDRLTVRINSPGGSVFDGNTIFNALRRFKAEIVTAVDGVAASAASLIAMAGDRIEMAGNAMMMVHQPYAWSDGTADEHRKVAETLDKVTENLVSAYANQAETDADTVKEWMAAETWFTADEAIEAGLATAVTSELQMAACIPPGIYAKAPKQWIVTAQRPDPPKSPPEPPGLADKRREAELWLCGP